MLKNRAFLKAKKKELKDLDFKSEIDPRKRIMATTIIEPKVRSVVKAINSFPKTFTVYSCEGHPERKGCWPPTVWGVSNGEDLNILVKCASKSGLELRVEPQNSVYSVCERYNLSSDMRMWLLYPKETEDFAEAHRKFTQFQELILSYRQLAFNRDRPLFGKTAILTALRNILFPLIFLLFFLRLFWIS